MKNLFEWGDMLIVAKDRDEARRLLLDEEHGGLTQAHLDRGDDVSEAYDKNCQLDGMFTFDADGEPVEIAPQLTVAEYLDSFKGAKGVVPCFDP